ncbi:hypothetical protein QBC44DRAFT_357460 [Cladorrhinum sp. PSN332]|nr:hypothetical protein QBC44DRAFT_357460 [Cladorrhinum sp. PSN332]
MKFSIITVFAVTLSQFGMASPVGKAANSEHSPLMERQDSDRIFLTPSGHNGTTTPTTPKPVLGKRVPVGMMRTWTTNPYTSCSGTAGQTINHPENGWCYHHGTGAPQVFVRADWWGNLCDTILYSAPGCNPATIVSQHISRETCWGGVLGPPPQGWSFMSFKLVC